MPHEASPDPVLVQLGGRRRWLFPDGTTLPLVAGGDGPDDGDQDGTDDGAAGADDGEGQKNVDDEPLRPEGKRALDAWKDRSKAAEAEAKRLREENEQLRLSQLPEQEREIERVKAEARESARVEVLGQVTTKLLMSELRAATTGALLPAAAADLLVDPTVAQKIGRAHV